MNFKNKKITIMGMGKTGLALARFLKGHGARVFVSDAAPASKLGVPIAALKEMGVPFEVGGHSERCLDADMLILSPGISPEMPILEKAKKQGISIIGELDLVSPWLKCPIIAITGTNGKTTTTTLIGEMLKTSGYKVWVGGNIGRPLIEAVDVEADYLVVEVSSFQLETSEKFHPYIAICLNVDDDHLDRHASFASYLQCKLKIARNQKANDWFVYDGDNPFLAAHLYQIKSKKLPLCFDKRPLWGGFLTDSHIVVNAREKWKVPLSEIGLKGRHNYKNIMAALLTAQILNCDLRKVIQVLKDFKGLPHRIEWVRSIDGIDFYDDSKATNVAATIAALQTIEPPIVLIAGGLGKGQDFSPLLPFLVNRVKAVVLIGESANQIAKVTRQAVTTFIFKDFKSAIQKAFELAHPRGTVLLSPACASFDMFQSYAERGNRFKEIVGEL